MTAYTDFSYLQHVAAGNHECLVKIIVVCNVPVSTLLLSTVTTLLHWQKECPQHLAPSTVQTSLLSPLPFTRSYFSLPCPAMRSVTRLCHCLRRQTDHFHRQCLHRNNWGIYLSLCRTKYTTQGLTDRSSSRSNLVLLLISTRSSFSLLSFALSVWAPLSSSMLRCKERNYFAHGCQHLFWTVSIYNKSSEN